MTEDSLTRRRLLAGAAGLAGAAATACASADSHDQTSARLSVPANGREYLRVALRSDVVTVSAVQSRVRAVDASSPAKGIRANLDHMLELIDKAQFYGGRKDLLCFHEFPLQGWNPWDRKEIQRLSIEIPGEETAEISARAKQYNCYIKFGAYVVDPDWPGHILSVTTIIGPDGAIVARDWKARNIKGVFPDFELVTTTVYNVLDRYIEMYGEDAVIPVHRTDIGNLTTSSTQLEPELFRAMAFKGAEIFLRTATGGFRPGDIQMTSAYNRVYSVIVNNAASPDNPGFMTDAGGGSGGTAIYGPRGEAVASADSKFEQQVVARLPMARFRARHQIPDVTWPCMRGPMRSINRGSNRACTRTTCRPASRTPNDSSPTKIAGAEDLCSTACTHSRCGYYPSIVRRPPLVGMSDASVHVTRITVRAPQ